ncbi:MAG: hypothetical protein U1F98_02500 [Verrucomicrobiota bacterium]
MMKFTWRFLWAGGLALVLALSSGCTSVSDSGPRRLGQTRDDIDWAMIHYHNRATFGFITPNMQQQVNQAYQNYQKAFDAALAAANKNYNAPTPPDVSQAANELLQTLAAVP